MNALTPIQWLVVLLGIVAGGYDLYVLRRFGIAAGKTVSWRLYCAAKSYPAIPFLAGCLAWAAAGDHAFELLAGFVMGHIFGDMNVDRPVDPLAEVYPHG